MRARKGYTLIEVIAAVALASIVVIKIGLITQMRARSDTQQNARLLLDDQARRVMEQIVFGVMGAAVELLSPSPEAPAYSNELRYQVAFGVDENGELVLDEPQWLGLEEEVDNQLVWRSKYESPDERRVVWCNAVRPFLEGEVLNGEDDNGNGLIDEKGLTFTVDGSRVVVRLSLHRPGNDGAPIVSSMEMTIACRN